MAQSKRGRMLALKPSYIRKLKRIKSEPIVHIGTIGAFRKRYHLD
jgi:hypothetical protein